MWGQASFACRTQPLPPFRAGRARRRPRRPRPKPSLPLRCALARPCPCLPADADLVYSREVGVDLYIQHLELWAPGAPGYPFGDAPDSATALNEAKAHWDAHRQVGGCVVVGGSTGGGLGWARTGAGMGSAAAGRPVRASAPRGDAARLQAVRPLTCPSVCPPAQDVRRAVVHHLATRVQDGGLR